MAIWTFCNEKNLGFEVKKHAVRRRLPRFIGDEKAFRLEEKEFDFGIEMGVMAAMSILTENIGSVKWPVNWIEAIKERFAPKFLLRKYPIRYDCIDIKALYPHVTDPKNAILKEELIPFKKIMINKSKK